MAWVLTGAMEEATQEKGTISGKALSSENASGIHERLELGNEL